MLVNEQSPEGNHFSLRNQGVLSDISIGRLTIPQGSLKCNLMLAIFTRCIPVKAKTRAKETPTKYAHSQ